MSDRSTYTRAQRFRSDFWKFWMGQTISTLGSSFTSFALPLLIFKLTGSSLNLALTVVATVLPYALFGLVIGAWVDRVNRKRLMIVTDVVRALVIASLPLVFAFGFLSVWWIYAVAFVNSTLTICFDAANFAAIPSLVSQDDLVAANGRLQASYSAAKVLGPLLAGLLLVVISLPMLLLVDAASFLVSVGSLMLIRTSFNPPAGRVRASSTNIRQEIVEGLRYVWNHPILRWMIVLLYLINFILPTSNAQLVLFAKQWLGASDTQIGLLFAGASFGTLIFSLGAKRLHKYWSFSTMMLGALVMEGLLTAAPALTRWYWATLLFWAVRGGADILFTIAAYSLIQGIIPNHLLGRVITVVRVLTWSTGALGVLIGGLVIQQTKNVVLVYVVIGILIFSSALAFFLTPLGHAEQFLPKEEPPQMATEERTSS